MRVNTTKQEVKVEQMTAASCFAGGLQETTVKHWLDTGTTQNNHRCGLSTGTT
jgi:hypothetical protein